ncbi:hypothetical protein O6H91_02G135900 [Diphasiastrum complanatum]|uniref:Uncharacterized protein n=2 Tax=Diphasiastrum complanatum TaxID=34168 RepID=A0ACC2ELA1_DIPCM|nr:hypothetical protein O6H91_02G135500 [Diphasiastrum complanatum]KAJ7567193.1 hypothetical protein O6H91_02G135900 [Diphasiastrum complanatum]
MEFRGTNHGKVQQLAAVDTTSKNRLDLTEKTLLRSRYHTYNIDEEVICPKPRRASHISNASSDIFRAPFVKSNSVARADIEAGFEILNIFCQSVIGDTNFGCSPYFCGSPPSRSRNPVIHDVQFSDQKLLPAPSAFSQQINCCEPARVKESPIRVEGFVTAGREMRCSVSAQA